MVKIDKQSLVISIVLFGLGLLGVLFFNSLFNFVSPACSWSFFNPASWFTGLACLFAGLFVKFVIFIISIAFIIIGALKFILTLTGYKSKKATGRRWLGALLILVGLFTIEIPPVSGALITAGLGALTI